MKADYVPSPLNRQKPPCKIAAAARKDESRDELATQHAVKTRKGRKRATADEPITPSRPYPSNEQPTCQTVTPTSGAIAPAPPTLTSTSNAIRHELMSVAPSPKVSKLVANI